MKILIAEDDSASNLFLKETLQKAGYEVLEALDGNRAWHIIQTDKPKLALLDWMMPGIEGVELCKRIRKMQTENYTYVILLTSKSEKDDIIAGLNAGADDYIIKPFDRKVLCSRITVGARIIEYESLLAEKNRRLQRYSLEMETLAQERSEQLTHAERMATVGLLSAGIAHEINNPASFIAGNIQILDRFCRDMEPILRDKITSGGDNSQKLEFILKELPKTVDGIRNGVMRISRIVVGLKSFCRRNEKSIGACDINACIEQAIELCNNALKYQVTMEKDLMKTLPRIKADSQQMEQVMVNLFVNAADSIKEGPGSEKARGILGIKTAVLDNSVVITVSDTGTGIPEDNLEDIWKPFFTTKQPDKGTGLGLFTVRGIIENHGGQIKVSNRPNGGAEFVITLPIDKLD